MSANINFSLFHANWCGHCVEFNPEWKKIKNKLSSDLAQRGMRVNLSFNEYEADANPKEIAEAGVEGFPTIRVTINGHTDEYNGKRTKQAFCDYVVQKLKSNTQPQPQPHVGGGNKQIKNNDYYYNKYMKWKQKYLDAKNSMFD